MKTLQERTVCKLLLVGGSCMCDQAQQEKDTFQRLEIYKNNNNNNNNNNESLFHQKIKLHILCYNNTEDKKNYDKNIYIVCIYLKSMSLQ